MEISGYRHAYHRNGIGGEGSYVAFFYAHGLDGNDGPVPMMATLWGGDGDLPGECMVMALLDVAPIVADYVDGRVADGIGDYNRGKVEQFRYLGAWRSTDRFLPSLMPHFLAERARLWSAVATV